MLVALHGANLAVFFTYLELDSFPPCTGTDFDNLGRKLNADSL